MGLLPADQSVAEQIDFPPLWPGTDLVRFDGPDAPGVGETVSGFTNVSNYGVRSMVADDNLYVGTANDMNLNVGTNGNDGGWELIRLGSFNLAIPPVPALSVPALFVLLLGLLGLGRSALRRRRSA